MSKSLDTLPAVFFLLFGLCRNHTAEFAFEFIEDFNQLPSEIGFRLAVNIQRNAEKRFGYAAGYTSYGITVAANGYGVAHGILEIRGLQCAGNCLRHAVLTCAAVATSIHTVP